MWSFRRVCLAGDFAEGIVGQVVDNGRSVGASIVLGDISDCPQVVGELPEDVVGSVVGSEDLVDVGAVEVAGS